MPGLGDPLRLVEESGEVCTPRCTVCSREVPESLKREQRCFLHFMECLQADLFRLVKRTKSQPITRDLEKEMVRFVVDSSLRITSLATGGHCVDLREKTKFASLLMDLVTFRDDVDKAARRAF